MRVQSLCMCVCVRAVQKSKALVSVVPGVTLSVRWVVIVSVTVLLHKLPNVRAVGDT